MNDTSLRLSPGQVITAVKEKIVQAYYPEYFLTSVDGLIQTKQKKEITFDDTYMGTNCHLPLLVIWCIRWCCYYGFEIWLSLT